jgi:long-chain acyl-CoA synthetase
VQTSAVQVRTRAELIAGALDRSGLVSGDRVVLSLPNTVDLVAAVWACVASRRIAVPLDPRLTQGERDPILAEVEPALVLDSLAALSELLDGAAPAPLAEFPQSRPLHFTSGTTGRPKGVWSGFLDADDAAAMVWEERDLWGFAATDVNLVVSPLYHSAPLRFALGTVLAGGSVVVLPTFSVEGFAEACERYRPTTMFCVPAHLQRILASDTRPNVSTFRLVAHAGAPCPPQVRRGAYELFGEDSVWEFYGSTEGQWTACPAADWLAHPGTVGRARPGRTVSVDESDELWCAVPQWSRFEYWGDPERTALAWKNTAAGPAFTVGDLGRVEDGWVYLDARRTDLIITGGVNVYPAEVESTLSAVPGVIEIAVFGREDERWGQRVCAAYVGDADEAALRSFAQAHLAPPKRPKDYVRVAQLPRTATGKITRQQL